MIELRPFKALGTADYGWLDARYHFSFASYDDPDRHGWGRLLVWNDDTIAPNSGFARHGHRDMEIITYIREGAITHRDHLGNEGRTEAGDVQVMSAGKGILHEEWNLETVPTRLFQIWIEPDEKRVQPRWEQRRFPKEARTGALAPLASGRRPETGALFIHADAEVLGGVIAPGTTITHPLEPGRAAYLVCSAGVLDVDGHRLKTRDGAAIAGQTEIHLSVPRDAAGPAEVVLVDVKE